MNSTRTQPARLNPATLTGRRLPVALAIAALAAGLAGPAHAVVVTWTGAGPDSSWSRNVNWSSGKPPLNGDSLVFQGNRGLAAVNNIGNLSVAGIEFGAGASAFTLSGNSFTSLGGILNSSSSLQTISMGVALGANQAWDGGSAGMVFNGVITTNDQDLNLVNKVTVNETSNEPWRVASTGDAWLTIRGAQLNTGMTLVGDGAAGFGHVAISDATSSWTVGGGTGTLVIGRAGSAQLTMSGGQLKTGDTYIAGYYDNHPSNSGLVRVGADGAVGTKWTSTGTITVGSSSTTSNATLTVEQGGAVSSVRGRIGVFSGGGGAASVGRTSLLDGSQASWTIANGLEIGVEGTGTLSVNSGGKVSSGSVWIGGSSFATGASGVGVLSVNGTGASFSTGDFHVGYRGTGSLNLTNGASVVALSSTVGEKAGSVGTVSVSGAQSVWTTSGDLNVGGVGIGNLTVSAGGAVTSGDAYIGRDAIGVASVSTALVSGAGSTWATGGNLYVNNGSLLVDNGAVVSVVAAGVGGYAQGGGSITVQGAGSQFNASNGIFLATNELGGTGGSLTLLAGSSVTTPGVLLGPQGSLNLKGGTLSLLQSTDSTSSGTFTWTGGTLHVSGDASFGDGTLLHNSRMLSTGMTLAVDGMLNLSDATVLTMNGGQLQGGTINLLGVTSVGAGSTIATATRLSNFGSLQLAGGTLSGTGILYNAAAMTGYGRIDGSGGFTNGGLITQSGGNLVLTNTGNNVNLGTWVGLAGRQLDISGTDLSNQGLVQLNGGSVVGSGALVNTPLGTVSGSGRIDSIFFNQGSLVVDAGLTQITNSFTNQGQILLGANSATLSGGQIGNHGLIQGWGKINSNISNIDVKGVIEAQGGTLTLAGLIVSPNAGSLIAGSSAKLLVTQGLASNAGQVQLAGGTFDNNGKVMTNTTAGVISGYGTLRSGLLTQNGQIQFSGGAAVPTSVYSSILATAGSKTILSGNSNATFYNTVDVQSGAELRISGGSVATFFGLVQQRTGAQFTGTGTKRFEGGISVGASPGLGTDEGDVEFGESNVYLAEIGGITACTLACGTDPVVTNSSFDKYIVGGQLSLGGTLKLVSWNGFVAQAGQQFDLLDWGTVAGSFASIDASGFTLAAGTTLDLSQLGITGTISVTAVPEPGSLALLLAGLLGVGRIVSRRAKAD